MKQALIRQTRHLARVVVRRWLMSGRFPSKRFEWRQASDDTADVLMCLWNRPERMPDVLAQLDGQDWPGGVRLFLWNNRGKDHRRYLETLESYTPDGSLRGVEIVRSPYNLGSIARFYWARRLARRGTTQILVLDDDQDVDAGFVANAMNAASSRSVVAWWSWTILGSYWDRIPAGEGDRIDHVGPGGMICDATLFLDDRFFTDIPDRFGRMDDVWLSWFARSSGFDLRHLSTNVTFVLHETNQFHDQIDVKGEFYDYLRTLPSIGSV